MHKTNIVNIFDFSHISIGKGTYGGIFVILTADDSDVKNGNLCSIGPKVIFMG